MTEKKTEMISLEENKIYFVKNNELVSVDPPSGGFGDQTLFWANGEVVRIDTNSVMKMKMAKER